MAGLLDGLGMVGLSNLSDLNIFEKKAKPKDIKVSEPKDNVDEKELLYSKKYECPCCGEEFPSLSVRAGRVKRIDADQDLRPIYDPIDSLKYDVVLCPYCGYADFPKTFYQLSDFQRNEVKQKITMSYVPQLDFPPVYDYDRAFRHYQMALATAVVTHSKASQRAYICLKAGWILRGQQEDLDPSADGYVSKLEALKAKEKEFLSNALEGFIAARQSEAFPIADMNEITLDYLIGALSLKEGKLDVASKMVFSVLHSKNASSRVKDKAREMKEMITEEIEARERQAGRR